MLKHPKHPWCAALGELAWFSPSGFPFPTLLLFSSAFTLLPLNPSCPVNSLLTVMWTEYMDHSISFGVFLGKSVHDGKHRLTFPPDLLLCEQLRELAMFLQLTSDGG